MIFKNKIEVVKLFYKGYNDYLPKMLLKSICSKRVCSNSLRVKNNLMAFKFNTKFIKNSLEYRGLVFWNLVHDSEDGSHLSLFKRKRNEDYFKDFNIKM